MVSVDPITLLIYSLMYILRILYRLFPFVSYLQLGYGNSLKEKKRHWMKRVNISFLLGWWNLVTCLVPSLHFLRNLIKLKIRLWFSLNLIIILDDSFKKRKKEVNFYEKFGRRSEVFSLQSDFSRSLTCSYTYYRHLYFRKNDRSKISTQNRKKTYIF